MKTLLSLPFSGYISLLLSYQGIFKKGFHNFPPFTFDFTGDNLPLTLSTPRRVTKVKGNGGVKPYNLYFYVKLKYSIFNN